MKIVVTGAAGQLGRELVQVFGDHEVTGLGSTDLDIANRRAVFDALQALKPEYVVNAAAYTKVDACEADPEPAWAVNAAGPWNLAQACSAVGSSLVHVSTDYVFDGHASRPYTEFDATEPASVYGRTKAAGEKLVRETLDRHYIVRTAWLHGQYGGNFVKTMLRIGRERGEAAVVDDQRGSPSFAEDVALSIVDLVGCDSFGTYHRTNTGDCTWFDLAEAAFERARLKVTMKRVSSEAVAAPAPRPKNSVLENRRASLAGLPPLPDWHDGLDRFLRRIL